MNCFKLVRFSVACGSVQMQIQVHISFALLCFILGNAGFLTTITFVAVLLYNFVRFNHFGNAFQSSNAELCGEISYAFRNNGGTVDCKESNFV